MTDGKPIRPIRRDELRKFKNIVVVFGSRKYNDRVTFAACLTGFISDRGLTKEDTVFVSGMAYDGPDALIVSWCKENGWRWFEQAADWENLDAAVCKVKTNANGQQYNALAGFNRNQEMANISTHGLGFWDGKSPGTGDMIERCSAKQMKLRIIQTAGFNNGKKP